MSLKLYYPGKTLPNGKYIEPGIGDVLFFEPALRHAAEESGEPSHLATIGRGRVRDLFEGREDIVVEPEGFVPQDKDWINVGTWCAENISEKHDNEHWVDCAYRMCGMEPSKYPNKERRYRILPQSLSGFDIGMERYIVIAPFSASCASVLYGWKPNKELSVDWWSHFAKEFTKRHGACVVCCGHKDAEIVEGTIPLYGHSLRDVASVLNNALAYVGIATGIMVMADALDKNIAMCLFSEPRSMVEPLGDGLKYVHTGTIPHWNVEDALYVAAQLIGDQ